MTGVALGTGTGAPARTDAAATAAGDPRSRLWVEAALFAALGGFALAHWSGLVIDPPAERLVAALAIVTAAAVALGLLAGRGDGRSMRIAAIAIGAGATVAALVVVGLPLRLLWVGNWGELVDSIGNGLIGIEESELPYPGDDVWTRLTLLLGGPFALGLAATLAFMPSRRRRLMRTVALALLVGLYAVAVTLDAPGSEMLLGIVLLVLAAGWLWLPDLAPRSAAVATAAVIAAGVVAVPAAARLDPGQPWWDYETWELFSGDHSVSFDWNHSYGPLEWPQRGTGLLDVRSTRPLYWKASVLDRFDGFTWQRARSDDDLAAAERGARRTVPGGELADRHREWLTQTSFEVTALESGLVISTGTAQVVQGIDEVSISDDGTLNAGEPLARGDRYSVVSYSPQPNGSQLDAAPSSYAERRFAGSTLIGLPARTVPLDASNPEIDGPAAFGFAPGRPRSMPTWPRRPDQRLEAELLASPYADTYRLARRLTAGAETPLQAVRAIETELRSGYNYSPNVPERTYPLASFLFEDRAGYCQQYAGAMALMLRMLGIPSRVVSGFSPGRYDQEREVYEIRDLDAHSWVEVYFRGIGWVTFDPTPAAAPAASQAATTQLGTFFRGRGSVADQAQGRAQSIEEAIGGGIVPGSAGGGGGPWGEIALALTAAAVAAGGVAGLVFMRRRRALVDGEAVVDQLAELRSALARLGWNVSDRVTLLGLERRFSGAGRGPVARYAAGLRAHRYAAQTPDAPGPAARRAVRTALADGGGLRRRLRALIAIPPGGPRRSKS